MPPRAARLDPRDAYCSVTESAAPPHHPHHAMRPRSPRERLTPLGLAPPAYSRSQVQPLPSRRSRDASAAAHSPPLSRARDRPPSLLARERPALACSSPRAEDARERAGGLVSTLTPRRVARRRGSLRLALSSHSACPLSSTIFVHSLIHTPCPCTNIPPIISTVFFDPHSHGRDPIDSFLTVPSYFPPYRNSFDRLCSTSSNSSSCRPTVIGSLSRSLHLRRRRVPTSRRVFARSETALPRDLQDLSSRPLAVTGVAGGQHDRCRSQGRQHPVQGRARFARGRHPAQGRARFAPVREQAARFA